MILRKTFLIILLLLNGYVQAQLCFLPEVITKVSDAGQGITSADFDKDGKKDMVITLCYNKQLEKLKGLGTGSFLTMGKMSSPYCTGIIISTDINKDGEIDLVSSNGLHLVNIFHGNGNFSFNPTLQLNYPDGYGNTGIAAADFNVDGKRDLVVCHDDTKNMSVLMNYGNPYGPGASTFNVGAGSFDVVTADFNMDGKIDVVTANQAINTISFLAGDGLGNFSAPITYPTDLYPTHLTMADFNNDGKPDVATANSGANTATTTISVLLNDGQGGFLPSVNYFVGNYPYAIANGDYNGDGNTDIVSAVSFDKKVAILLGNGTGGFALPFYLSVFDSPNFIINEDFNSDGKSDIAVGYVYGVGVFLNSTPSLSSSSFSICAGESATITADENHPYLWNTGATTSLIIVSPSVTSIYTVSVSVPSCTFTASQTIVVDNCTGIHFVNSTPFINIYPNPSHGFVTIASEYNVDVEITNELGQVVKKVHICEKSSYQSNVLNLQPGFYSISTASDQGKRNYKLVVNSH